MFRLVRAQLERNEHLYGILSIKKARLSGQQVEDLSRSMLWQAQLEPFSLALTSV